MVVANWSPLSVSPAKICKCLNERLFLSSNNQLGFSKGYGLKASSFKLSFTKKNNSLISEEFSVLSSEFEWDSGTTWSTMGLYIFSLHIPLSFGGLSVVAQIMHQPVLDPQTEAVSLLLLQTIELLGALALLRYTMKTKFKLESFSKGNEFSEERNWVIASVVGFVFLISFVVLSSFLADRLFGPKDVNNPIVKEILTSGPIGKSTIFLAYCFITPLLEETIYRGFLLNSLTTKMKWQQAVLLSSLMFSFAHFSIENSLQLYVIGCVLGCSYCWSGNLISSISIHALYNAFTLIVTML